MVPCKVEQSRSETLLGCHRKAGGDCLICYPTHSSIFESSSLLHLIRTYFLPLEPPFSGSFFEPKVKIYLLVIIDYMIQLF